MAIPAGGDLYHRRALAAQPARIVVRLQVADDHSHPQPVLKVGQCALQQGRLAGAGRGDDAEDAQPGHLEPPPVVRRERRVMAENRLADLNGPVIRHRLHPCSIRDWPSPLHPLADARVSGDGVTIPRTPIRTP